MHSLRNHWVGLILCFLLACPLTVKCQTSKGTEFWLSFMENIPLNMNGNPAFSIIVSSDFSTSGSVTVVSTGLQISFSVSAGQSVEVPFPSAIFYPQGSEAVTWFGLHIVSGAPVSISAQHYRAYFSDATAVLPASELGNAYRILTHADDAGNWVSEFVVVATEDSSVVTITPSVVTMGLRPSGVPFSVTLNRGQTYQVQSLGDLTGTTVVETTGKKLAVFSGAAGATIGRNCSADNTLYDQDYPVSAWGTEYLAVSFFNQGGDPIRILANEDQTLLQFNCANSRILNKGEFYDTVVVTSLHLTSTKPVAIGQFNKGQTCNTSQLGDPTFLMLHPLSFISRESLFQTVNSNAVMNNMFSNHYVNIIARSADLNRLYYDNALILPSFYPVSSDPAYAYAQLAVTSGAHSLRCDSGFYAYMYGFGYYDAYSFFLSYDGSRLSPNGISISASGSFCKDSIQFTSSGGINPVAWNWDFGDGYTSILSSPEHTYNVPSGFYLASLQVQEADGCFYSGRLGLNLGDCGDCVIFVPNVFSPNNDGANDQVYVFSNCIRNVDFSIFDRWGELVFHTTQKEIGWDGTYKGKPMDAGVFVYSLKGTYDTGKAFEKKGTIALVR